MKIAKNNYQYEDYVFYEFLRIIYKNKDFLPLQSAIDTNEEGCEDYYQVIKTPMYLDMVLYKYINGKYLYLRQLFRDLDLIYTNIITFIGDSNQDMVDLAKKYREFLEQQKKKLKDIIIAKDFDEDQELLIDPRRIDIGCPLLQEEYQKQQSCNTSSNQQAVSQNSQQNQSSNQRGNEAQQKNKSSRSTRKTREKSQIEESEEIEDTFRNSKSNHKSSSRYIDEELEEGNEEQQQQSQNLQELYKLEEKIYNHLLKPIYNKKNFSIFQERVDESMAGCENYYEIIKNPMWFDNIYEKWKQGQYHYMKEIVYDLKLIKSNCILFNGEDNEYTGPICDQYEEFLNKTQEKLIKMLKNAGIDKEQKIKPFCEYTLLNDEDRKAYFKEQEIQEKMEQEHQMKLKKSEKSVIEEEKELLHKSDSVTSNKRTTRETLNSLRKQSEQNTYDIDSNRSGLHQQDSNSYIRSQDLELGSQSHKQQQNLKSSTKKRKNPSTNKKHKNNKNFENEEDDSENHDYQDQPTKKIKFYEEYSDVNVDEYEEVIDSFYTEEVGNKELQQEIYDNNDGSNSTQHPFVQDKQVTEGAITNNVLDQQNLENQCKQNVESMEVEQKETLQQQENHF